MMDKEEEKERKEVEREERVPGRCALFIKKRGRYCRLFVAKGSEYCGEHLTFDPELGASSEQRRIPCPLDPKHTVYEHKLQAHLKKCNAAKKIVPACYKANINTGIPDYQPSEEEKKPLSAFSQSQLEAVIAKVEQVYQECMVDIEEVVLEHPVMNSDLTDPANGATALKHIRQQASILGHLEKLQLIQPNTCFIEFGAGRGKLSNCLQRVCVDDDSIQYLLVDRDNCRRKKDVYLRGDPSNEARVQRLNIDIKDLDLGTGRVEVVQRSEVRHVVAISKHLCGPATDLTLRCLLETLPQSLDHHQPIEMQDSDDVTLRHRESTGEPPKAKRTCTRQDPSSKLRGVVIALCCHHRCSWNQLAGTSWLNGRGFSPIDAHLVTKMTSWAVCGVRSPDHDMEHDHHTNFPDLKSVIATTADHTQSQVTMVTDSTHSLATMTTEPTYSTKADFPVITTPSSNSPITTTADPTHPPVTTVTSSTPHPPWYHPHPREEIGLKCKRVLDLARLHYLRVRGMDGRLLYFVSRNTSLENVLLVATPVIPDLNRIF